MAKISIFSLLKSLGLFQQQRVQLKDYILKPFLNWDVALQQSCAYPLQEVLCATSRKSWMDFICLGDVHFCSSHVSFSLAWNLHAMVGAVATIQALGQWSRKVPWTWVLGVSVAATQVPTCLDLDFVYMREIHFCVKWLQFCIFCSFTWT